MLTTAIPGVLAQAGVLPADVADPIRYGGLDVGYLELTSLSGFTTLLFGPAGSYDVNVLLADFNMRGTISVGEAATIAFGTSTAAAYTGPVFVMNGQHGKRNITQIHQRRANKWSFHRYSILQWPRSQPRIARPPTTMYRWTAQLHGSNSNSVPQF